MIVGPTPWAELLAELGRTPGHVRALAPGLAAASIVESLCVYELPYRAGLVLTVLEDNPVLPPEPEPEAGDSPPPLPAGIERFAALRRDTLAFLEHLPPDARARVAFHPSLGRVTLREQVAALLVHDLVALRETYSPSALRPHRRRIRNARRPQSAGNRTLFKEVSWKTHSML